MGRKTRELALAYEDAKRTQAVEDWVKKLEAPEEVLSFKQDWRKPRQSRSDRRRGLDGKRHRLARARAHTAWMISVHRERNFEIGEGRMIQHHVDHHQCVMNARIRKAHMAEMQAAEYARNAIAAFPAGPLLTILL